jgi:chromosome segregation ATPase
MEWLTWFGRWGDKDRAYARLKELKERYGSHGDRVIKLSARTDLARKSAGATKAAFEYVERAFGAATQEYARIGELFSQLEAGLARGRVGDFAAVEKALTGLGPKLDELDRTLTQWESQWQQVPRQIDEVAGELAQLRVQVEAAAAGAGAPLPLTDRLTHLEQYLQKTRQTLAAGNPAEAGHQAEDLRMAMAKVADQAAQYTGALSAITQAEQGIAQVKALAADPHAAEVAAALAAADALLSRLRPSLAAGKLEQFQADLVALHKQLSAARAAQRS